MEKETMMMDKEFNSVIDFINNNKKYLSGLSYNAFMSLMGMLGDEYGAHHSEFIPYKEWEKLSVVSRSIYEEMGYMGVGE